MTCNEPMIRAINPYCFNESEIRYNEIDAIKIDGCVEDKSTFFIKT